MTSGTPRWWRRCLVLLFCPEFLHGFVKIDTWISLSCFMDLSKFFFVFHSFFINIPMTSGTPRWWRHRLVLLFCPELQCTPPLPRPPPLIQSFPRVSFTVFSVFFTPSSKISFSMIQTLPGVPFSVISLSLSCTTSVEKFQVFFFQLGPMPPSGRRTETGSSGQDTVWCGYIL